MQRYLVTGVSGFVAKHFLNLLEEKGEPCEVIGLDVNSSSIGGYRFPISVEVMNLLDSQAINNFIVKFKPTRILHLASFSSVAESWKSPVTSFNNNTNIFLNVLDPLRMNNIPCKVLSVGSSEEYGVVTPAELPLRETQPLNPGSPYGVARVAQEQLSRLFAQGYGLDVVMTRSFNHIGPGQRDQFVISSFVKQVVQARRAGHKSLVLRSGNTKVIRDFLDVRDVVRAYFELLVNGRKGEVYNICSGIGQSLDHVLSTLSELTGVTITQEVAPELLRPNELLEIVGSAGKIHSELGWTPRIDFRTSLLDMVDYWDDKLSQDGNPDIPR
ncbi:MAG: GDP-mannose 4,6-dehydratase [Treponemataceae bacterium]